eukprot:3968289-Amphidinium_carterae.1
MRYALVIAAGTADGAGSMDRGAFLIASVSGKDGRRQSLGLDTLVECAQSSWRRRLCATGEKKVEPFLKEHHQSCDVPYVGSN